VLARRPALLAPLALVAALLAAGCGGGGGSTGTTVSEAERTGTVPVGQSIPIGFNLATGTGYQWSVRSKPSFVTVTGPRQILSKPDEPGAMGEQRFTARVDAGATPGATGKIVFVLKTPAQKAVQTSTTPITVGG
jgi:hypothetical protein